MCKQLFDTLQLCTCDIDLEDLPENYWILRRQNNELFSIVGQSIMPLSIRIDSANWPEDYRLALEQVHNSHRLLRNLIERYLLMALNKGKIVFDFPY